MNKVTISTGSFTVMCVAIVVLLILVILLYSKEQPLLANVLNFQKTLEDAKFSGAALVKRDGNLLVFDKALSLRQPCGESRESTTIPPTCAQALGDPTGLNPATAMIFPKSNTLLLHTGDPWYSLCLDGTYPPCHRK